MKNAQYPTESTLTPRSRDHPPGADQSISALLPAAAPGPARHRACAWRPAAALAR